MPRIQPIIQADINPLKPIPEICEIIRAVSAYHPGQEQDILKGVKDAIDRRLSHLQKGDNKDAK